MQRRVRPQRNLLPATPRIRGTRIGTRAPPAPRPRVGAVPAAIAAALRAALAGQCHHLRRATPRQHQGIEPRNESTLAPLQIGVSRERMISTRPSFAPLRFLTARRTLISAPLSRWGDVRLCQRHQTTGCGSRFKFQLRFAHPLRARHLRCEPVIGTNPRGGWMSPTGPSDRGWRAMLLAAYSHEPKVNSALPAAAATYWVPSTSYEIGPLTSVHPGSPSTTRFIGGVESHEVAFSPQSGTQVRRGSQNPARRHQSFRVATPVDQCWVDRDDCTTRRDHPTKLLIGLPFRNGGIGTFCAGDDTPPPVKT